MRGCFLCLISVCAAILIATPSGAQERRPRRTEPADPGGPGRVPPGGPGQKPEARDVRDPIDARAPENRNASALLKRTRRSIADNDWGTAIQQLQSILNEPGDALIRLGPGRFASMRSEANRLLLGMPRVWKQRYISQFGAAAGKQLADALRKGNYSQVGDVATRYLHTDAGALAARAIAMRHVDRGEFGMALRWFELLRMAGHEPTTDIERMQQAVARRLSGLDATDLPDSISLGGSDVDPASLLAEVTSGETARMGQATWPVFLGDARHTALAVDRVPLMVAGWEQPLVPAGRVADMAGGIMRRVLDNQPGLVHAGMPIVTKNRVACRTPEGVSVYDVQSGELVWRTRREESSSTRFRAAPLTAGTRTYGMSSSGSREEIVEAFMFRDAVHGLIASDGEQLIVVEQQGLPTQSLATSRFQNARSLELIRRNAINQLVSYDLKSGAQLWSVGGLETPEAFQPVLAGEYFHGVPVPVDNELFVVGEKDNAIRLHALAASTGELKWSQLLAYSDTRIERDVARRYWASQITVADGMLICPTSADWIVAVDPLTRGIVWAHRHQPPGVPGPSAAQQSIRPLTPLTGQWPAAAPVVVGDRVICTPAELGILEGLDLITGERIWSHAKSDMRYVAGVNGGNIIVVSLNRVSAMRAADGKSLWTTNLESDTPAGRGVVTRNSLHLPTSAGQILTLDLSDGTITHRTGEPRAERLLANLVLHAGGAILQSPVSLTSLDLRPDANAPTQTPAEQLRAAEIAFSDGRLDEALELLDRADPDVLDEPSRKRRRHTLVRTLRQRVEQGVPTAADDLKRLEDLVTDRRELTRLKIVRDTTAGRYAAAFIQLVAFYREKHSDPISDDDRLTVSADQWLGGRLADLWQRMDESARADVADHVAKLVNEAPDRRLAGVFAFHPATYPVMRAQLLTDLEQGRFVEAEQSLRWLGRYAPKETVNDVAYLVASGLAESGQHVDARSLLGQYGLTGRIDELPKPPEPGPDRWDGAEWSVSQFAGGGALPRIPEIQAYRSDVQFHRDFICFSSTTEHQRVHFYSRPENRIHWSLPLRQASSVRSITPNGRSLILAQRNMISCLAPTEKRVLWQHPVSVSSARTPRVFSTLRPAMAMQQPPVMTGRTTPLAVINEELVCLRGQRSMEVRSAVTGELWWSRDDIGPNDAVLGTTEAIFIRSANGRTRAYRASDGQALPEIRFTKTRRAFSAIGRFLVLIEESGFLFRKSVVQLHDPISGEDAWRLTFPADSEFAMTDSRELVVRTDKSTFEIVNLVTGARTALKTEADFEDETLTVAATSEHVLMAGLKAGSMYYRSTSQSLHGDLRAFDRQSGEELWERDVNQGSILLSHFRSLPVLLMTENEARLHKDSGKVWDFHLVSPATGKTLISHRVGSRYDQGHPTRFQPAYGFVEILLSNRRFRFTARQKEPAAKP